LQSNLKRIERLFPAVYVTLISILLGFAIEDLINRIRELSSINIYAVLVAISILCAIFAAWTGYSFVSMTQERLPRLLDCVNVFVLAFGVYLLNSTLGMEIWFFFVAVFVYFVGALFATLYNFGILLQNLPTTYTMRNFRWDILLIAHNFAIYPVAAWMSMRGMLSPGIEIFLIVYFSVVSILWVYFFYKTWSSLIKDME
jgi:hypothetical protein